DLPLALDETSGGVFTLDTPRPVIPAGSTEVHVRLTLSPTAAALGHGAQAGQGTGRLGAPPRRAGPRRPGGPGDGAAGQPRRPRVRGCHRRARSGARGRPRGLTRAEPRGGADARAG